MKIVNANASQHSNVVGFFLPRNPLGKVLIQIRPEVARRVLASDCLSSGVVGSGCFGTGSWGISACFDGNRVGHMVAIDSIGAGDGCVGPASRLPAVARDVGSRTNLQRHPITGIFLKASFNPSGCPGKWEVAQKEVRTCCGLLSTVHREFSKAFAVRNAVGDTSFHLGGWDGEKEISLFRRMLLPWAIFPPAFLDNLLGWRRNLTGSTSCPAVALL